MSEGNSLLEQKRRLRKVVEYLKTQGYSQKEICEKTKIMDPDLSNFKNDNGKIKVIPTSFLEELRKEFMINPDYIRRKSNNMFDNRGLEIEYFQKFVDDWSTVSNDESDYLYLKIDSNFYNFLIELEKYKRQDEEGVFEIQEVIEKLRPLYDGTPRIKEYVLLEKNTFIDIVRDTSEKNKQLHEVIDFLIYEDILEEESDKKEKIKHE